MYLAAESSGDIGSSAQAITGQGRLTALLVIAPTNDTTVILYDNTSAAGKKLWEAQVLTANQYGGRNWTIPVKFTNGVYASITGTNGSCIVEWASP